MFVKVLTILRVGLFLTLIWLLPTTYLSFNDTINDTSSVSILSLAKFPHVHSPAQKEATPSPLPLPPTSAFSYVFYATGDEYACSALVNVHRLQNVFNTTERITLIATSSVSESFLDAFRDRNVTIIIHEAPPLVGHSIPYYEDVLLKLVCFKVHHYDPSIKRILALDSDQLILRPLDDLFRLVSVDVASPRAYWISNSAASSTFILAEPSDRLWRRIEVAMSEIPDDKYDMDLLNNLLDLEMMLLPGEYIALNSHWEDNNIPAWFREDDELLTNPVTTPIANTTHPNAESEESSLMKKLYRLYEQVSVLHFTALGKPWEYTVADVHAKRPDAHPLFAEQFSLWRTTAAKVCPGHWNGSFIEVI